MARVKREPVRFHGPGVDPRTGYVIPAWLDPRVWDAAIRRQKKFTLMEFLGLYAIPPSEADITLRSDRSNLDKQMRERGEWADWGIPKSFSLPEAAERIAYDRGLELGTAERLMREALAWHVFHTPGKVTGESDYDSWSRFEALIRELFEIDPLFVWRCLWPFVEACVARIKDASARVVWEGHLRAMRAWLRNPSGPLPSSARQWPALDGRLTEEDLSQQSVSDALTQVSVSLRGISTHSGKLAGFRERSTLWELGAGDRTYKERLRNESRAGATMFITWYESLRIEEELREDYKRMYPGVSLSLNAYARRTGPGAYDSAYMTDALRRVRREIREEFAGQVLSQPFTHLEAFHEVAINGWNAYFARAREERRGD